MAMLRSPLPDSSNLEAGIVEDARPSRFSRVHDNVRNLLRRSVFGSVHSTPVASPTRSPSSHIDPTPTILPTAQHPCQQTSPARPLATSPTFPPDDVPGVLFPAWRGQPSPPAMIDTNSQTTAPRAHPDLSPNVMSLFLQQKTIQQHHHHRQQKAWKRQRNRKPKKSTSCMQWFICSVLGVTVLGLLATYIALVTSDLPATALTHVMFILALLLTSIVFAHTLVRLCCLSKRHDKKTIVRIEPAPRRRHHRRHHSPPTISDATTTNATTAHYIPPTPIAVQSHDPEPIDTAHAPEMSQVSDKGFAILNPPPAYGSTTSSVRADPELLFWHAIPSPVEGGMPSPTYEEAVRERTADRQAADGARTV